MPFGGKINRLEVQGQSLLLDTVILIVYFFGFLFIRAVFFVEKNVFTFKILGLVELESVGLSEIS